MRFVKLLLISLALLVLSACAPVKNNAGNVLAILPGKPVPVKETASFQLSEKGRAAGVTERLIILTPPGDNPFYAIKACDYRAATGNVFALDAPLLVDYPQSILVAPQKLALSGTKQGKQLIALYLFEDEFDTSPEPTVIASSLSESFELLDMNEKYLAVLKYGNAPGHEGERWFVFYSTDNGKEIASYDAAEGTCVGLGGDYAAFNNSDKEIEIYNLRTKRQTRSIRVSRYELAEVGQVDVSPDGRWVCYLDPEGNLILFDEEDRPYLAHTEAIEIVELSDKYLIYKSFSGLYGINLTEMRRFRFRVESPRLVFFHDDLLICQDDYSIRVFQIQR